MNTTEFRKKIYKLVVVLTVLCSLITGALPLYAAEQVLPDDEEMTVVTEFDDIEQIDEVTENAEIEEAEETEEKYDTEEELKTEAATETEENIETVEEAVLPEVEATEEITETEEVTEGNDVGIKVPEEDVEPTETVETEEIVGFVGSGSCGADAIWTLTGERYNYILTISGSGEMADFTEYSQPWSSYKNEIKKVVIGEGISYIGNYSFTGLYELEEASLPDSLTGIGYEAFSYCKDLADVTLPDNLTSIGEYAFLECSGIIQITIPEGVTCIRNAFYCCNCLTEVTLPEGMPAIDDGAFCGCARLQEIIIPDSVTRIGDDAFAHCYMLSSVMIPNSVTEIGCRAFYDGRCLKEITVPASVISIGKDAFGRSDVIVHYEKDEAEEVPAISIEKASVAGVSLSYGYSGRAYTPTVTVKVKGRILEEGIDYTVVYENNIDPGTATITITGIGRYEGTRVKNFYIVDCVSELVSGKTYQLIPKNNSSTAVCAWSGRMINNTKVYITNRSNSEAMKFMALENPDGTWKFVNAKCELALAVRGNSSEVGNGLIIYEPKDISAQNWKLSRKSDNSFAIINSASNLSVSMSDASAAKGTTLSLKETASSGLQRFYIVETSEIYAPYDGVYTIRASKNERYTLNAAPDRQNTVSNVNIHTYSNNGSYKYRFVYSGGGYYRLVNEETGCVLTVKNNTKANGANVIQSEWKGQSGQRWKVSENSDGTVTLINALGTILHLNGNQTKNGTNVVARKAMSTGAQRWYLIK